MVYTVPVYMVMVHKLADMLVVYMVMCLNGVAVGLLEVFVGMPG